MAKGRVKKTAGAADAIKTDKAARTTRKTATIKTAEPPAKMSAQYGKRADSDYAQISVQVPKELRKDFKQMLLEYETDASTVFEELITEWLKDKTIK